MAEEKKVRNFLSDLGLIFKGATVNVGPFTIDIWQEPEVQKDKTSGLKARRDQLLEELKKVTDEIDEEKGRDFNGRN